MNIIILYITRQIKSQLIDPANEEQRREGLDSALIGKAVASNTPGTSWVIVQFYPECGLLYYISLYISTVLTLLCLPYHQLRRGPWVLCGQSSTLCAWSAPDWSQLKSTSVKADSAQKEMRTQFIMDYKQYMDECLTHKIFSMTFGHIQIVQCFVGTQQHKMLFYTRKTRQNDLY